MNKIWTPQEVSYLKENAGIYTDEKLAKEMQSLFSRDFSISALRKKRQRLNIKKVAHRSYFKVLNNDVE